MSPHNVTGGKGFLTLNTGICIIIVVVVELSRQIWGKFLADILPFRIRFMKQIRILVAKMKRIRIHKKQYHTREATEEKFLYFNGSAIKRGG